MEEQVKQLVDRTWTNFRTLPPTKRLLIAISGIPGSGKTTLAKRVSQNLNAVHRAFNPGSGSQEPPISVVIPIDGYHLTRSQLAALPNSQEAIFRRGAAFTFNSTSYLSLIHQLRADLPLPPSNMGNEDLVGKGETIYAPSFDHAIKDPVENDIAILPSSRILIIEGLYLSLSSPSTTLPISHSNPDYKPPDPPHSPEWSQAGNLMDEHWFISIPYEMAAKRLVKRHLESGICENEDIAKQRVWESDMRNGREIVEGRREFRDGVDVVLKSWDDEGWK